MKTIWLGVGKLAFAMVLGALSLGALAQDDAEEAPPPPPATEEGGQSENAEPREAGGDADDVFIPSEEIPADEEVTFPVNI